VASSGQGKIIKDSLETVGYGIAAFFSDEQNQYLFSVTSQQLVRLETQVRILFPSFWFSFNSKSARVGYN
jgi:hypothetical protein